MRSRSCWRAAAAADGAAGAAAVGAAGAVAAAGLEAISDADVNWNLRGVGRRSRARAHAGPSYQPAGIALHWHPRARGPHAPRGSRWGVRRGEHARPVGQGRRRGARGLLPRSSARQAARERHVGAAGAAGASIAARGERSRRRLVRFTRGDSGGHAAGRRPEELARGPLLLLRGDLALRVGFAPRVVVCAARFAIMDTATGREGEIERGVVCVPQPRVGGLGGRGARAPAAANAAASASAALPPALLSAGAGGAAGAPDAEAGALAATGAFTFVMYACGVPVTHKKTHTRPPVLCTAPPPRAAVGTGDTDRRGGQRPVQPLDRAALGLGGALARLRRRRAVRHGCARRLQQQP